MNHPHAINTLGLTPQQYAQRIDRAKEEAVRLRSEAIDAFAGTLVDAARSAISGWRRRTHIAPAAKRLGQPCQR
jgi:hypothetical protein